MFGSDDMYAQDSIDLLTKSGIDFKKNQDYGKNLSWSQLSSHLSI